jgi:hypothetical protein
MRTFITLAIGFWIAREISTQYEKRMCIEIQFRQKRRLEAFLKKQGYNESDIKKHTRSVLKL